MCGVVITTTQPLQLASAAVMEAAYRSPLTTVGLTQLKLSTGFSGIEHA